MALSSTFKYWQHFKPPIGDACYRILFALIFVSAPLVIPSFVDASYPMSLKHNFHSLCAWVKTRYCPKILWRDHQTRYASQKEEERYWARAIPAQKWLSSSSTRIRTDAKMLTNIPLVTSYSPALLPLYRVPQTQHPEDEDEYYLSARTLCKWHRMVFPGPVHPTLQQAAKLRRNFSNRDRREMFRISRMLPDEVVFGRRYKWTPKYRSLWRQWRADRQPDIVVLFA